MPAFKSKPSRGDVAKSIQQISLLWARPPDTGKEKAAAPARAKAAFKITTNSQDSTPDYAQHKGAK